MITSRIKRIGGRFNIKTVFKTKYTLGNLLSKMISSTDTLERPQYVYRIPHECGREYIGKTSRQLKIRISEFKYCIIEDGNTLTNLSRYHMLLWEDIRSIGLMQQYYNLSLIAY